jgi:hypothetical protein
MIRGSFITIGIILIVAVASVTLAEVPQLISYQGRLTESDGRPVADGLFVYYLGSNVPLPAWYQHRERSRSYVRRSNR